ncbi:unnamed protein product [Agarophyton chilense]
MSTRGAKTRTLGALLWVCTGIRGNLYQAICKVDIGVKEEFKNATPHAVQRTVSVSGPSPDNESEMNEQADLLRNPQA